MTREHHVIAVPGLGGGNRLFDRVVESWKRFGVIPHSHDITWKDIETFDPKLQRLLNEIDELQRKNNIVSLVGTSAGGSMVLNAFYERQDSIHKVINICGRLREGTHVSPSLSEASKESVCFRESVLRWESLEPQLTQEARKKIMTIRALIDKVVPTSTTTIEGGTNIQVYSVGHMISIATAMTIYIKPMINFLKEDL